MPYHLSCVLKNEGNMSFKLKRSQEKLKPFNRVRYPFPNMEVDDYFEINQEQRDNVATAASAFKRKTGKVITIRKQSSGVYRVQRIS